MVAFLCTSEASYITGTTIVVDGGQWRGPSHDMLGKVKESLEGPEATLYQVVGLLKSLIREGSVCSAILQGWFIFSLSGNSGLVPLVPPLAALLGNCEEAFSRCAERLANFLRLPTTQQNPSSLVWRELLEKQVDGTGDNPPAIFQMLRLLRLGDAKSVREKIQKDDGAAGVDGVKSLSSRASPALVVAACNASLRLSASSALEALHETPVYMWDLGSKIAAKGDEIKSNMTNLLGWQEGIESPLSSKFLQMLPSSDPSASSSSSLLVSRFNRILSHPLANCTPQDQRAIARLVRGLLLRLGGVSSAALPSSEAALHASGSGGEKSPEEGSQEEDLEKVLEKLSTNGLSRLAAVMSSFMSFCEELCESLAMQFRQLDLKVALAFLGLDALPASKRELRRRYFELSLRLHPDKHPASSSTCYVQMFQQLQVYKQELDTAIERSVVERGQSTCDQTTGLSNLREDKGGKDKGGKVRGGGRSQGSKPSNVANRKIPVTTREHVIGTVTTALPSCVDSVELQQNNLTDRNIEILQNLIQMDMATFRANLQTFLRTLTDLLQSSNTYSNELLLDILIPQLYLACHVLESYDPNDSLLQTALPGTTTLPSSPSVLSDRIKKTFCSTEQTSPQTN
eukprot:GHVS01014947.1.p1 GENE.GHVS01014947.1~~GHVS01014947.1.p1  ORF type:complete len:639 (+),score=107.40 GHVS01014947.1:34-1917(+)